MTYRVKPKEKEKILEWANHFQLTLKGPLKEAFIQEVASRLKISKVASKTKEELVKEIVQHKPLTSSKVVVDTLPPPPPYEEKEKETTTHSRKKKETPEIPTPENKEAGADRDYPLVDKIMFESETCDGPLQRRMDGTNLCMHVDRLLPNLSAKDISKANYSLAARQELAKKALKELEKSIDASGILKETKQSHKEKLAIEALHNLQQYMEQLKYEMIVACASFDHNQEGCEKTGFCVFEATSSFYQVWKRGEGKCRAKGMEKEQDFLQQAATDIRTTNREMKELSDLEKMKKEGEKLTNRQRIRLAELKMKEKNMTAFLKAFRDTMTETQRLEEDRAALEIEIGEQRKRNRDTSALIKKLTSLNEQIIHSKKNFLERIGSQVSNGIGALNNPWVWASLFLITGATASQTFFDASAKNANAIAKQFKEQTKLAYAQTESNKFYHQTAQKFIDMVDPIVSVGAGYLGTLNPLTWGHTLGNGLTSVSKGANKLAQDVSSIASWASGLFSRSS